MRESLKNHPFAVEAFFKRSIVLTFAVPKNELHQLIPDCLSLDTFDDEWGFIAIAMVQTRDLRPKGFPTFLGQDFFLIGYRVFVKYRNQADKRLRGLFILKSETDRKFMEVFGNLFTHYRYTTTDISQVRINDSIETSSLKSGFRFKIELGAGDVPLPVDSPFPDWKTARRYAGPLPFTFTCDPDRNEVLIIEGVRQNWIPKPIIVTEYECSFLESLNLDKPILANAFTITDIPYYWKRGKIEKWHSQMTGHQPV